MAHNPPKTNPLAPYTRKHIPLEQIAKLSEETYSQLTEVICSLQVIKALQADVITHGCGRNFRALETLHKSIRGKTIKLESLTHELRRAIDPDEFARVFINRAVIILDTQDKDTKAHRAKSNRGKGRA